jgi:hemerythrin-like metal-binding protein
MNRTTATFLPSALLTNNELLDEQHAGLFSRLAGLKMQCIETNDLPDDEAVSLLKSLREHCATEEQLAEASGIDFATHAGKHHKMLAAIDKAMWEIHEHKIDVFSVLRYIEYWFERHITEEDQAFCRKLQTVAKSPTTEEREFRPMLAAARRQHVPPLAQCRP